MVLQALKFATSALVVKAVDKRYSAAPPVAQPALNAESLTAGVVLDEEDEGDDQAPKTSTSIVFSFPTYR